MATVAEALDLAFELTATGRVADSERICLEILRAVPDTVEAAYLLGSIRAQQGRFRHAHNPLAWAAAVAPGVPAFRMALANVFFAEGHAARAEAVHRHTARLDAGLIEVWSGWAAALRALDRSGEAAACCRRALTLAPDFADAWLNLADAEVAVKRTAEAGRAVERALCLAPDLPAALMVKGLAASLAGDDDAADAALSKALALEPGLPGGWENLGSARARAGRVEAAEAAFAEAAARRPGPALWSLRGNARLSLGWPGEALKDLDRAVAARPNDAGLLWNRGLARLSLGDFAGGFADFDHRRIPGHNRPRWTGGDIAGQRILLYAEQGLGDTLQFLRYVPMVAALGARVFLEVQPALRGLAAGVPGVEALLVQGETVPETELECPLMSLPRAFGTTVETIPAPVPYLRADPALAAAWRARIGEEGPRVGIVWAGNPAFTFDRHRSPGLAAFRPLLDVPGLRFFGLQLGAGRRDLNGFDAPPSFRDLGAEIRSLDDTAAIMDNLDLVISSCTAPVHLAGALGRPLWLALGFAADWRWLTGREDSPWYPSARLFRQPRFGDWGGLAARMAGALARWRDAKSP